MEKSGVISLNEAMRRYNETQQEFSCKPSGKFRRVKNGEVLDDEKTVRWNREEAERLNNEYDEEVKRLNREKAALLSLYENRIIEIAASNAGVGLEEANALWLHARHRGGNIFAIKDKFDEYAAVFADVTSATKKKSKKAKKADE